MILRNELLLLVISLINKHYLCCNIYFQIGMRWLGRASYMLARSWRAQPSVPRSSGPLAKYTVRDGMLLSGVLSWLGFSAEPEPEHDLIMTIKRGILAAQEGDLKKADQIFHVALRMAVDLGHEEGQTHIYCLLANTALERGFIGQAERLFTEVLKRILANGEPQDSNSVVEISLKLAGIFVLQNELGKAEQGFEFCTKTQQLKVESEGDGCSEDTLALYGLSLDKQGQFLLNRGRLQGAENCFSAAVKVSTRLHGENDQQTLVVRNSLATVLSLKGETDRALSILSNIISRAEETQSQYLPTFLINKGIVGLRSGCAETARADCTRARAEAVVRNDPEATQEADECLKQLLALAA